MPETTNETPAAGGIRGALAGGLRRLADAVGREPVLDDLHLVHTLPKTGTVTLLQFLQELGLPGVVRGTYHQLGWEQPGEAWEWDRRSRSFLAGAAWERGLANERWAVHRHLRARAPAVGCVPPRRGCVISSTREPVGRQLSGAFFRSRTSSVPIGVEAAVARLTQQKPLARGMLSGAHWWELDAWFDHNVKGPLGIDVFAKPFDQARGWQIYEGEHARLLLIRQESFARLPEAVSAFYGLRVRPAAIPHANAGEGHAYRGSYREAKERIRIPAPFLDTVYSARYARHFYSPDEIRGFKERWSEPAS